MNMLKVALGRIGKPMPRQDDWRRSLEAETMASDEFIFAADAFAVPEYDIFGVAHSYHPYDSFPFAQRDVRLAFDTIRAALHLHDRPQVETDSTFLQKLLMLVVDAFTDLNEPPGDEDYSTAPWVAITLARLQEKRLTYALVGNVRTYVIESEACTKIIPVVRAAALKPGIDPSGMELRELAVEPGEMVVLATWDMEKIIRAANLSELVEKGLYDPEVADRRLLDRIEFQPGADAPPETVRLAQSTRRTLQFMGAAWAIAYAEGKPDTTKKRRRPKKLKRRVWSTDDYDDCWLMHSHDF